jgi:hypothetical protein
MLTKVVALRPMGSRNKLLARVPAGVAAQGFVGADRQA